ncbi:hypothetical protein I6F11_27670 [Ensifer sp. NBAIM29]|nr:hypothetical protein [Ensifer sp. NBAIM29]
MAVRDLIGEIENASAPERHLDSAIGILLGWKRKVEYVKTDEHGEPVRKVFWIVPTGDDYGKVPRFTNSLDAAMMLAREISPDSVGGVSWEKDGQGTAVLGEGPYCRAATPAMALCVAALRAKLAADEDDDE